MAYPDDADYADFEVGLLLAEDDALKRKLSGLTVRDPKLQSGRRKVGVWFRLPEGERTKLYPFLTLDLVAITPALDRAHDQNIVDGIDYWPSTWSDAYEAYPDLDIDPDEGLDVVSATRFMPHNLYYQVSTHTRTAQHDRELQGLLLGTAFLPYRWGYLDVPADGTCRWLDLENWVQADTYDTDPNGANTFRVFRKVYTVAVTAMLPLEDPFVLRRVLEVHGRLTSAPLGDDLLGEWHVPEGAVASGS